MKKTLLLVALMVCFSMTGPRQGNAGVSVSAEYHVLTGLGVGEVHYFDSIFAGAKAAYISLFGNALFTSMNGSLGAGPLGDSINSALSPYGGKRIGIPMVSTPLQREFAALNLRTAVFGLERQTASGSHRPWAALTRKERAVLREETFPSQMVGR